MLVLLPPKLQAFHTCSDLLSAVKLTLSSLLHYKDLVSLFQHYSCHMAGPVGHVTSQKVVSIAVRLCTSEDLTGMIILLASQFSSRAVVI